MALKRLAAPTGSGMGIGSAIISGLGSAFGGIMADKGQRAANKANLKIAREQMAFQEKMSSTAYQRAAKDLSAAGLNRILAIGSPASSPSGALATMQSETAGKADALKTGTASALQAKIANQQFKQIQAQTRNLDQQTLHEIEKTGTQSAQRRIVENTANALEIVKPGVEVLKDLSNPLDNSMSRSLGKWIYENIHPKPNPYPKGKVRIGKNGKSEGVPLTWPQILKRMKDL